MSTYVAEPIDRNDPHALIDHLFRMEDMISVAVVRLENGTFSAAVVLNGAPEAGVALFAVKKLTDLIQSGALGDTFRMTGEIEITQAAQLDETSKLH